MLEQHKPIVKVNGQNEGANINPVTSLYSVVCDISRAVEQVDYSSIRHCNLI